MNKNLFGSSPKKKALMPNLVAGTSPGRRSSKEASSPFFEKKGPKKLSPFVSPAAFLAPQAITLASQADRHADARSDGLRPRPLRDRDSSAQRNE
jgi:hypothetical protein